MLQFMGSMLGPFMLPGLPCPQVAHCLWGGLTVSETLYPGPQPHLVLIPFSSTTIISEQAHSCSPFWVLTGSGSCAVTSWAVLR